MLSLDSFNPTSILFLLSPIGTIFILKVHRGIDYHRQLFHLHFVFIFTCTVLHFSVLALIYAVYILNWIIKKDSGSVEMQQIAEYIIEGSEGFFAAQYGTIFKLSFVFAVAIFLLYWSKVRKLSLIR